MTEHPLLFTSEMVICILTCAKCGKISIPFPCEHCGSEEFCKTQTRRVPVERYRNWKVGDVIWGREAWCYAAMSGYDARDDGGEIWYRATDAGICEGPWKPSIHLFRKDARIFLEITGLREEQVQDIGESAAVAEGVERYETAGLEGWKPYKYFTKNTVECKARRASTVCKTARNSFISLWDSINAKRKKGIYAWDENPLTKVIEFKRIEML